MDVTVELPAEAEVERQGRAHAEAILRIQAESSERITLHALGEVVVLMGLLVQIRGHGNLGDPACQERIEVKRIIDIIAGGVDVRQRIAQHVVDRIGGYYAEAVDRHAGGAPSV